MTKHPQEYAIHPDGWSRWIYPIMYGYKMTCCDCGLVHDMEFRVTDAYDRVEFRVRRNNRSTGQIRRAVKKVLTDNSGSKKLKVKRGKCLSQK